MTLSEMVRSEEYDSFLADRFGNNLFINDPERAIRVNEAAEYGSDGSLTSEVIEDWKAFLETLKISEEGEEGDITQEQYEALCLEIEKIEEWHESKGTLYLQRG